MDKLIFPHHYQQLSKADLSEAVQSYRKDLHPNETRSCILLWSELKQLVADTEKIHGDGSVDGIRIYFYRADDRKEYIGPGQKIHAVGDKTQLSIMVVPMNRYNYSSPAIAYDMFDQEGKVWVLIPGGEHTGLCPTNCGGSI